MNTKRIFIGAASLLMSFALSAAEVSSEDVELVAKGWARDNAGTFGKIGAFKSVKAERDASGQVLWYWSVMEGGALVVAPDTEIEPVVAALPGCDGTLPANHPMRALLRGDLARRLAQVKAQASSGTGGRSLMAAAPLSPLAAKWQRLKGRANPRPSFLSAPYFVARPATIVKWLDGWNEADNRITCWTQEAPFNNYAPLSMTPLGPMPSVVGCVATAGSSVLHYFRASGCASNLVSVCKVDNVETNFCTKGGVYDWSLFDEELDELQQLTLANPKFLEYLEYVDLLGADAILAALDGAGEPMIVEKLAALDDETKEALKSFLELYGALDATGLEEYNDWVENGMKTIDDLVARVSYDVGLLSHMSYSAAASGAFGFDLATALRKHFGLASARYVNKSGPNGGNRVSIPSEFYPDLVYNQIRAGSPVIFGIDSSKATGNVGHEVVACGYGIDTENTDYTFIFCGWAGTGDAWYALPHIDTKATAGGSSAEYDTIGEMIVSLSTNACYVPLVGRVVDTDGLPVTNDLWLADGTLVHPDTNGYWGVRINPNLPNKVIYDPVGDPHAFVVGSDAVTPKTFVESSTGDAIAAETLAAALPDAMEIVVKREQIEKRFEIFSDYETAARRALAEGKLLYVFGGSDEAAVTALKEDFRANSNETFYSSYVFWQVDANRYSTLAQGPFFAGAADPRTINPYVAWSEANGRWTAGLDAWALTNRAAVSLTLSGPTSINTAEVGSYKYELTVVYADGLTNSLNAALVDWSVDDAGKASVSLGYLTPVRGANGVVTVTADASASLGAEDFSADQLVTLSDGPCVIVGGCRTNTCIIAVDNDANVRDRELEIAQGNQSGNPGLITPRYVRNEFDETTAAFGSTLKLEMQASRTFENYVLRCVGLEVVADGVVVTNVTFDATNTAKTVAYDYTVSGAVTRVGWHWKTDKYYVELGSAGNATLDRGTDYYPAGSNLVVNVLSGTDVDEASEWVAVWSGCSRLEAGETNATLNVDYAPRNVWAYAVNVSDETVKPLDVPSTNGLVVAKGYKIELVRVNESDWGEETTYTIKVVRGDTPDPKEVKPPAAVPGLVYDGACKTGVVELTGFTLTGNVATNVGTYRAVAKLADGYVWTGGGLGDVAVYWTIYSGSTPPGPGPEPEPEYVSPDPIAFTSIEKVDGEWVLVATNAKQWCEYALWSGTTLKTNEWVALEESDWKQWEETFVTITNRVPEVDGEAQRFWIIRARPGLKPAE